MRLLRRFGATAAVLTLLVVPAIAGIAGAAPIDTSDPTGADNVAIAVNTKDGSSLFKFAFSITEATGTVVDAGNGAAAVASCTECKTVAIAIQFVIVQGSPEVFVPENVAVAANISCSLCNTLASAYQFVIQTSGPVELTKEGAKQLHDLAKQIDKLRKGDLTIEEIQVRVDEIANQMAGVMATELVPAPPTGRRSGAGDDPASTTTSTSTTTPGTGGTTVASTTTTTTRVEGTTTTTAVTRSTTTTTAGTSTTTTERATTTTTTPATAAP